MSYKVAMFAGGCFWCAAKPYYEYEGVLHVYSGYAGGDEVNPKYEDVKNHKTGHRETIKIIYDSNIISFEELLDVFLETIDPFDEYGQFIDRGFNYTCAIFTNDLEERKICQMKIMDIERQYNKKAFVPILDEPIFYMAEEYHQDYAIKNPEEMEKELLESGRKK